MKKLFNTEFSITQFLFWGCYCGVASFASAFLLSRGFDNTTIGTVISSGSLLSIIMGPLIADFADKHRQYSGMKILAYIFAFMLVILFPILFIKEGRMILSVSFCISLAIINATISNINALSFELEETGNKINYGFGRAMGSLGYALVSLFLGGLILRFGSDTVIIFCIVLSLSLSLIMTLTDRHYRKCAVKEKDREKTLPVSTGEFFRNNKSLILFCLFASLVYFMSNVLNTYMYQAVIAVGGDSSDMGRIFSIMAFVEIPVLFIFDRLRKRFSLESLMIFATFNYVIKSLFFLSGNIAFFYVGQLFQMTSYAIFMPSIIVYISSNTARNEAVRGQAVYNTFNCIMGIIAQFAGGIILDHFGVRILLYLSVCVTLFGSLMTVIYLFKRKAV